MIKFKLKDSLSKKLVYVGPRNTLDEAYCIMRDRNIRHLPVIGEDGLVIGMLSDRDLQRAMRSEVKVAGKFREEEMEFPEGTLVEHYMNWPVKSVDVDGDLVEVAQMMIQEKISAVLVAESQAIVGIITHEDLLKVLCKLLEEAPEDLTTKIRNVIYDPALNYMARVIGETGI